MELRQLRYILAVAEAGSFSRAAEQVHISQPSLSQQVRQVEEELGTPLFSRGTSGTIPTAAGEVVVRQTRAILGRLEEMQQELADLENLRQGRLVIGSLTITGGHILPPVVAAFRSLHPGVNLQLIEERTPTLLAATTAGQTDLSVMTLPLDNPDLAWEPLLEEELVLAVPQSHRLAVGGPVRLSEVAMEPFVLLKKGNGFRTVCDAACARAGFSPQCVFETDSIETAKTLVAAGLGVTLVPELIAGLLPEYNLGARQDERLTYLHLQSPPTRTVVVAWRRDRYLSRAAQAFQAMLHTYWAKAGATNGHGNNSSDGCSIG